MQSILTSLIFEHALKMRVREDTSSGAARSSELGRAIEANRETDSQDQPPTSVPVAGMLTDLITSDLDNLQSGNEFVGSGRHLLPSWQLFLADPAPAIDSPIKFVLGVVFVYFVLDWR